MVKMKKITVLILTLALVVAALVGVTATASADEEVTPVEATELTTFNMDHGASVRKVGMNGLRFSAKMSSAEYLGLAEQYGAENLSFGILIFPYDYLSEYDETSFTWGADADEKTYIGDKEIIDLRSPIMGDDGDYMTIAGSIINIKDKNLNRSFNGRAYVRYVEEGVAKYVFASLDENTRTMLYVAQKALKEDADLTDDDKDAINSTYLSEEKINGLKATYNVEVYYEESTGKNNVANYVLSDEDSFELTAQINAEISVEKRVFDDNTYVYVENENEKLSDVVMADGSSVLKVYYRKLYPYTVYVLGNKTYVGDEFDTAALSNFVIVEQNTKYGYAGQTVTENYQTYENSYRDNKGILLGYYTNSIATKTVTADGSAAIRLIFSISMVYRPEGANYRFYLKECDFRSDPIDTYAEIVDDPTVGTAIKFTTFTANDWYSRSTIIYLEDGKSGVSFNKTHNETLGYDRITYKLKFDAGATPEMFTYKGGTNIVKLKTDLADYSSVVKFYDLAAYKAGTAITPVTSPVADTWYAVEVDISNAEYLTNATTNIINPTVNPVANTAMYIADFKITKSSEYTAEYKTAKYGEQLASKTAAELSMPSTVKVTPDGTVFNLPAKDGYRLLNYSIDKANAMVTFNYREIEYEEYTVNHYVVGESQPFATSTETGILGDSITAVKKTSRYYTYAQNESEVLSDTLTGEGKVLKVYYNKAEDTALYSDDGKAAIAYGLVNTQNNSEWFASYQGVNDVIKVTRKATDTSTGANQWGARVPFATYANDHYDATKAQFDAAYGTDTYVVKVKMFYESSSHPFFNPFTTELGNGTANIYFYDASNNGDKNPDGKYFKVFDAATYGTENQVALSNAVAGKWLVIEIYIGTGHIDGSNGTGYMFSLRPYLYGESIYLADLSVSKYPMDSIETNVSGTVLRSYQDRAGISVFKYSDGYRVDDRNGSGQNRTSLFLHVVSSDYAALKNTYKTMSFKIKMPTISQNLVFYSGANNATFAASFSQTNNVNSASNYFKVLDENGDRVGYNSDTKLQSNVWYTVVVHLEPCSTDKFVFCLGSSESAGVDVVYYIDDVTFSTEEYSV